MAKKEKPSVAGQPEMDEKYRVEDAARTIERYAELCSDEGLHTKAMAHMKKKMGHMDKIMSTDGLREKARAVDKKEKGDY